MMKKNMRWLILLVILLLLMNTGCARKDGAGEQATMDQWVEQAGEENQPQQEPPAADKKEPSAEEPKKEQEQPEKQEPAEPVQPQAPQKENIEYRIDPKLSSVIRQIESDFSKTMKEDGTYLVSRYYGTFNGAVPVMMSGYGTDSGSHKDTVAESVFHYTDGDAIRVWKENRFYSMEDAYAQGFLTKEQVATVADRHKNGTDIKMDGISEGIHTPDVELLEQIKRDYIKLQKPPKGVTLTVKNCDIPDYYGIYSGAAAVDIRLDIASETIAVFWDEKVAESVFEDYHLYERTITIWADGAFHSLKEAFEGELLSKEQIATLADVFNGHKEIDLRNKDKGNI